MLEQKIEALQVQVDPKRIENLESEIKNSRRKLIRLDDDMIDDAKAEIRAMEAQLEKLKAQLRSDIDVQKWPPEIANLYRSVLTKPPTLPGDQRSVGSDNCLPGPGLREHSQPRATQPRRGL
jgi:septal ring factor EnvC (AmiA/AmiB activator)